MTIIKTSINDVEKNFAKFDLALICEDMYKVLSDSDKILYTILKNQESLSIKNAQNGNMKYVDSNGYIFIEISQAKLCKLLNKSEPTIRKSLNSLAKVGLIERVSSGYQKCDKIYVGNAVSTLTLGDYFKKISIEMEEENKKEDKKISIKASRIEDINKKASTLPQVEAEKIKPNKSICNSDINNTSSTKKNQCKKVESEVVKAINKSCVNIRKQDLKDCEEEFTDIDRLKEALNICEVNNNHGIKALRMAYMYGDINNSLNKKQSTVFMADSKVEVDGQLKSASNITEEEMMYKLDLKNGTNWSGKNPNGRKRINQGCDIG